MMMGNNYLQHYLSLTPTALAIVRANECCQLAPILMERPILDLGSGDGIFAKIFFSQPVDVGIDISVEETCRAVHQKIYNELFVADAHQMPFSSNRFATVFSNSVLEHIPN